MIYGSPKEILKKMWQIETLSVLRHLQDLWYKMVKAREAEGTSIHKKQISNYIPTEKLPLDIKKKALDKRKKSAINDYHEKLKVTECFKRKQHFTL